MFHDLALMVAGVVVGFIFGSIGMYIFIQLYRKHPANQSEEEKT